MYFFSQSAFSGDPDPGAYVATFKAGAAGYSYVKPGETTPTTFAPGEVIGAASFGFDPGTPSAAPVSITIDWTQFAPFTVLARVISVDAHQVAEGSGPSRLRGLQVTYFSHDPPTSTNVPDINFILTIDPGLTSSSVGNWSLFGGFPSFPAIASGTYLLRNTVTIVPEPPTLLILFAGIIPLIILARRRLGG
ncbi:MAG: PEP-CTERM sorting domain-containing protein [Gammaproteobacteria bacterium]|nr:PEP-CTERM sorting domain-containing protein [Gammaproteobacteria bacterium]